MWKSGLIKPNPLKGSNHPNWKGGRYKNSKGYIVLKCPDHPRADRDGYVAEHILVWEKTHGKLLPLNWHIHHLNGIKDDNRPENLLGLPRDRHHSGLVRMAMAKRIQELEALLNNQHQLL